MSLTRITLSAGAAIALLGLFACDNGPSAVRTRDRTAMAGYAPAGETRTDPGKEPGVTRWAGRDSDGGFDDAASAERVSDDIGWAASRGHSAGESAAYQYRKNGADFGASSVGDYVKKARAFVTHPPKSAERVERRNGDVLFYDPRTNVFVVATRRGDPRTMFKPRDGAAYWEQQKARASAPRRAKRADDDNG